MAEKIKNTVPRIEFYKRLGYDIRLTDSKKPYIENVIDFPDYIIIPW